MTRPAVPPPFPPLAPSDLDAEQAALYDKIAGGPRASSPIPLVDDAGHLAGPFNALLHAPAIGDAVQNLGAQLRYASALTPRERELATLLVAGHDDCAYELYAHRRLAAAAGIAPETIEALAAGQVPPLADTREQLVTQFCAELLDGAPAPEVVSAAVESLGAPLVFELVVLVGYYQLLSRLLDVADVGDPERE